MPTAPAIFIAHGAPSLALEEDDFTIRLHAYGQSLSPRAIVIVSAHWQTRGEPRANAVARPEPIYDFGGFSRDLYKVRYDAPGDPALAEEVAALTGATLETSRGWDHGLWVPLLHFRRAADVPVVELSLPYPATAGELLGMGRALAPLRERNIVIAGSGGVVHNLGMIDLGGGKDAQPAPWAIAFDDWLAARLAARDTHAIAHFRDHAPHAALAVPTPEHFEPLLVVLGAATDEDELVTIHEGFHYGSLSMRTIAFERK